MLPTTSDKCYLQPATNVHYNQWQMLPTTSDKCSLQPATNVTYNQRQMITPTGAYFYSKCATQERAVGLPSLGAYLIINVRLRSKDGNTWTVLLVKVPRGNLICNDGIIPSDGKASQNGSTLHVSRRFVSATDNCHFPTPPSPTTPAKTCHQEENKPLPSYDPFD